MDEREPNPQQEPASKLDNNTTQTHSISSRRNRSWLIALTLAGGTTVSGIAINSVDAESTVAIARGPVPAWNQPPTPTPYCSSTPEGTRTPYPTKTPYVTETPTHIVTLTPTATGTRAHPT